MKPGKIALVIDPDFAKDFKLPRGVCVVTVSGKNLGNGLANDDVVTLFTPAGKAVDSCELSTKTKKGEAVHRKWLNLPSGPSNWEVAPASPGKRAK